MFKCIYLRFRSIASIALSSLLLGHSFAYVSFAYVSVANASDAEPVLPHYSVEKHMGVATCGNAECHGVTQLEEPSNVLQNEYTTWLFHDRHAKAYNTLLSDESKRIAQKLGLEDASKADMCLDCHADNVAAEKRGEEFHITDGVGCEACHGGSENWLGTHTIQPYSLSRNLADGMYPTSELHTRTKLCVSCHIGTQNKFANHNIMGAGHPRLGFELDTFTLRQPEHYVVDADYLERKNPDSPIIRLLVGAAVQAQSVAENLQSDLIDHPQGYPEIAAYDCHSCHHSLSDIKWQQRPSTAGLKPGALRLNDASFVLLAALAGAVDSALEAEILDGIRTLHQSSTKSIKGLQAAASDLQAIAKRSESLFSDAELNKDTKTKLLKSLMRTGIKGEYRDFVAAEQAVMAMDALSYSLPENIELTNTINRAYRFTANDEAYDSIKLRKELERYLQSVR